jgi:hypothetical protein
MKNIFYLTFAIISLTFISCEKEEDLSPREDLQGAQAFDINIPPNGGTGGGGTGGGTGGGAPNISEYFRANVDGVFLSTTDPLYQEGMGIYQVTSTISSANDVIQVNFLNEPTAGNQTALVSYIKTPVNTYENRAANVFIDTLNADKIVARFTFEVFSTGTIPDTILIAGGAFRVAR